MADAVATTPLELAGPLDRSALQRRMLRVLVGAR
jgi:hypothetical protein